MEIISKKLGEIRPYEKNPRRNDSAVEYVANSIKEFGFKVPIVIDKDGVIVCGHTRWKAAKKLGMKEVPCIMADDLTPEQIKAFRLADNKVSELAEWDFDLLSEELGGLDMDMSEFGFVDGTDEEQAEREEAEAKIKLADKFLVPPFSVLDTTKGYWQDRKHTWKTLIKDDGTARENASLHKSLTRLYQKATHDNNSFTDYGSGASLLDPVLAEVIVTWFSPINGNKTYDCFAGDTAFGFVSSYLGKEFTGIELRQEQASFNQERCDEYGLPAQYICDDGRNILNHIPEESQDLFFSCPPYFDLEVYSDKENDASNQKTYEDFYKILDEAFTNAGKCLKNNRFAVVTAGDIRNKKTGEYYDFPGDIKRTFIRNGFKLYNELILVRQIGSKKLTASNSMKNRKVTSVHEEVLVFYKGDKGKIKNEFTSDFLTERQNITAHEQVLVFYKGDQKRIQEEFGECEVKEIYEDGEGYEGGDI